MNTTTADNMNFIGQRNDDRVNAAIPSAMRKLLKKVSEKKNMSESSYMKLALQNQLIKDLAEE